MRDPSGGPVLVMRRASNCISALAVAALAATIGPIELVAQVPGRNVNMVSGTTLPDGDPFLQRQNEPSVAASTRNPQHLLAGANDYRTVDLPGLPDDLENGDAWLGNGQRIAAGNVYIVFTVFNGPGAAAASESGRPENILRDKEDDQKDKDGKRKDSDDEERLHGRIMFSRSRNCGATWSKPERISSADDVNQGAAIAIDPSSDTIYVAWRQFADPIAGTPDGITVSTTGPNPSVLVRSAAALADASSVPSPTCASMLAASGPPHHCRRSGTHRGFQTLERLDAALTKFLEEVRLVA